MAIGKLNFGGSDYSNATQSNSRTTKQSTNNSKDLSVFGSDTSDSRDDSFGSSLSSNSKGQTDSTYLLSTNKEPSQKEIPTQREPNTPGEQRRSYGEQLVYIGRLADRNEDGSIKKDGAGEILYCGGQVSLEDLLTSAEREAVENIGVENFSSRALSKEQLNGLKKIIKENDQVFKMIMYLVTDNLNIINEQCFDNLDQLYSSMDKSAHWDLGQHMRDYKAKLLQEKDERTATVDYSNKIENEYSAFNDFREKDNSLLKGMNLEYKSELGKMSEDEYMELAKLVDNDDKTNDVASDEMWSDTRFRALAKVIKSPEDLETFEANLKRLGKYGETTGAKNMEALEQKLVEYNPKFFETAQTASSSSKFATGQTQDLDASLLDTKPQGACEDSPTYRKILSTLQKELVDMQKNGVDSPLINNAVSDLKTAIANRNEEEVKNILKRGFTSKEVNAGVLTNLYDSVYGTEPSGGTRLDEYASSLPDSEKIEQKASSTPYSSTTKISSFKPQFSSYDEPTQRIQTYHTTTTTPSSTWTLPMDAAAARQGKALKVKTNGTNAAQSDLLDNAVVYPSALTIVADRLSNDSDNEFLAKLKEGADDLKEALNCYDLDASDLSSDSLSVPEGTDAVSFHLTSREATADNIKKIVQAIETQLPEMGDPLQDAMNVGDEISVAMIDKDLKFSEPFSQIKGGFDLDNQNYSAFGLTSNSEEAQRDQVSFCKLDDGNYATKLATKNEGESIILIPLDNNNRDSSHQELLDSLDNKKWSNAEENDSFKAPCLDFQQIAKAENPFGENTAAVQITKIKLDETGAELAATAAGSSGRCIIRPKAPDYTNGDFAMVMVREVNGKQVLIGGVKCEGDNRKDMYVKYQTIQ